MNKPFLTYFPGHVYRYIDLTGQGRPPKSKGKLDNDLNLKGYESYFTVNGFAGSPNAQKENCTNLNSFFIDIDGRKDLEELEKIKDKFDPTFITETQNGYHLYWLLDEPIFKADVSPGEWDESVAQWERIEQAIVTEFNADPPVKDVPRILRVPNTFYWKKTGDLWEKDPTKAFKIKGLYKNTSNNYSMNEVEEIIDVNSVTNNVSNIATFVEEKQLKIIEAEKNDFFRRVNEEFPIKERDSFNSLINANPESLKPGIGRNTTLHITVCLMRQAGWSFKKVVEHISNIGWHAMDTEPGGAQEIASTIKSAFEGNYTYSYKNEVIAYNMTPVENQKIQQAYTKVSKDRRDVDKIRFSNYEREILIKYPYLRKNEIGIIFQYDNQ
jgi:hypothetical protein